MVSIETSTDHGVSYYTNNSHIHTTLAQAMGDYSPFGSNLGTFAQCDGSEIHPWGLLNYSPCMSLAETCITLEHCSEATEHDDNSWKNDLSFLDWRPLVQTDSL